MVLDSCRRGDEGQTSSEYIGAFAIVIVLAAALAALTGSDVGQAVLDGTSRGICRVISVAGFGGDCNGGSVKAASNSHLPTDCTISSADSTVEGKLTLFSVSVGGDVGYVLERKSDGKWYLNLKGGAKVGLEGAFGEKAGASKVQEGAEGSFGVGIQGDGSSVYQFNSEKDARAALVRVETAAKGRALGTVEGQVAGSSVSVFGVPVPGLNPIGGIVGAFQGATADYDPHLPEFYQRSYDAGIYGEASGSAGTGPAYADGAVSSADVVGVTFGHDDNRNVRTTTVFFKTTTEGKGSAGVIFGASGSLEGETKIAVTFAAEGPDKGKPLGLSVENASNLSGGISTLGEIKNAAEATQVLKKLAIGGNQETGLAATLTAEYDLTDPATLGAMRNALTTLGIGVLGGPVHPSGVLDLATAAKSVSIVTYDTSKSTATAGFEVGDLIAFGAEGSYTRKTSSVANAVYLDPSKGGFVPWVQCSR